ncbi:MAG: hypothetical protein JO128_15275 [Alphaproteobacteria bacterium]|nr:hypothetical protein [Alphaproteobacteria bacterium]
MRLRNVAAATVVATVGFVYTVATGQPMPPSQPAVPQTMPPTQMPPEKIEPNHMPTPGAHQNLGQAPSGQPLTPGQPASPTQPLAPGGPDTRPMAPAPATTPPR